VNKEGLVACWRFDEGQGQVASDSSGNGQAGRVAGPVWRPGRVGSALEFSGGPERVEVPHHPSLCIREDITIAAWIFKQRPNRGERWDPVVAKTPNKWDYELLTSKARSDEPAFYSPTCTPNEVYAGVAVPSGRWQHLAVTRAGSRVVFYLNGDKVNEVEMVGLFPVVDGPLLIGHDGVDRNGSIVGLIDEIYLYKRALSAAEVGRLANPA